MKNFKEFQQELNEANFETLAINVSKFKNGKADIIEKLKKSGIENPDIEVEDGIAIVVNLNKLQKQKATVVLGKSSIF